MNQHLMLTVHLLDGRYHGMGEAMPSPARLFQALVAGAARSSLQERDRAALRWLEAKPAPMLCMPHFWHGQRFDLFVPNNDIDSVGGKLSRVGEIRTRKTVEPKLFNADTPLLFVWPLTAELADAHSAAEVCRLAAGVYQFGRGVDMAWMVGEVIDEATLAGKLQDYTGTIWRPTGGSGGRSLPCPRPGTLESLEFRFAASAQRLKPNRGIRRGQLLAQPPKPLLAQVAFEAPPNRLLYELRGLQDDASLCRWPLERAGELVVRVRDAAAERLRAALPARTAEIERTLIGRKADGADGGAARVRILPLPSIGHPHADLRIRRLLVDVPPECVLRSEDLQWAFSGLELSDPATGDVTGPLLVASSTSEMLRHYVVSPTDTPRIWRSVTPVALPEEARRRRIEPSRRIEEAKGSSERAAEEGRARAALAQALRHAGIRGRLSDVRVQREPYEKHGARAEAFAPGTRFPKERLWHVELELSSQEAGPLALGDGRFVGLGLFAPVRQTKGLYAFRIEHGLAQGADAIGVARCLRRAVMARTQVVLGQRSPLPPYFSGHAPGGELADGRRHPHLAFHLDPRGSRLLILAPHLLTGRGVSQSELRELDRLEEALNGFRELRAGLAGALVLSPCSVDVEEDPLFAASCTWQTLTPYVVTRHAKGVGARECLEEDVRAECIKRRLPVQVIRVAEVRGVSGVGLAGSVALHFDTAVRGPVILGRSRFLGGGLFGHSVADRFQASPAEISS